VVYKNGSGTVTKKVQYQYDVFNRRIGKKVDANGDGTYETGTYWVYDDAGKRDVNTGTAVDDIVLEFNDADGDGSGAAVLSARYVHGPGVDQILAAEIVSSNVVTWALADHQGTVRDMVRYASGTTTIVNHRKFDAFGNLTVESDSTVKFLFSYTGREWDGDAGLYYYRARWYDAKIGRFISQDPSGFDGSDTNLTRYVGNEATNCTDPTGWQKINNNRNFPDYTRYWPDYLLNECDDVATFRFMKEMTPDPDLSFIPLKPVPTNWATFQLPPGYPIHRFRAEWQDELPLPKIHMLKMLPLPDRVIGCLSGAIVSNIPNNYLVGVSGAEPCILVLIVNDHSVLGYHFNTSHLAYSTLVRDSSLIEDGARVLLGAGDTSAGSYHNLSDIKNFLDFKRADLVVDGIVDSSAIYVDNNGTYYSNSAAWNVFHPQ
jgi:RHS repeat-associated protein